MDRKPLPADYPTRPYNAAEMLLKLRDEVGLPLRDIIDLDLQQIYDLLAANIGPDDADEIERIVIVDDDTLEMLDRVVTGTISAVRPGRDMAGYEGWTSRTKGVAKLGNSQGGNTLPDLEAAIRKTFGVDEVVLEDKDYDQVMAALNAAISSRPHGRSPKLDARTDQAAVRAARSFTAAHRGRIRVPALDGHNADALDKEVASRFTVATLILMSTEFAREVRPNPRPAIYTFTPSGAEARLQEIARVKRQDVICLGFVPRREREGPVNFAVFEQRNGRLNSWIKCDPWSPPDESIIVLRARRDDFCFAFDGERIVLYHGRPQGRDVAPGIAKARYLLDQIANSAPEETAGPPDS